MDEIVISGISGRFPESNNMEEFKQHLLGGFDLTTKDNRRWPPGLYGTPPRMGKLSNLNRFDATFFGVHFKQADKMDPQQRILLETTFEAILDSGINPADIRGSRTGVFIGVSESEAFDYFNTDVDNIDGYAITGTCRSLLANRVSFVFDFKGPSFAIDTACSSTLNALQKGVAAIRAGECDAAIIGGSSICLKPHASLHYVRLGMLNMDGKCKSFDSSADGYVRAETVGVIFIQKASAARRIYASILGIKSNTDGYKSNGITYPSGEMQKKLMREIYDELGINPAEISYIEAHATGTSVGDPQEGNAITEIFCTNRSKPLLIGSVKSNMGHAEPAAGICSLAKLIIAMENGLIPANLHFKTPNPKIPALLDGRLEVVTQNQPWNGGLAAMNSFGFGGANVHLLLRSNPKQKSVSTSGSIPHLITVSGRTEDAVLHMQEKIEAHQDDEDLLGLIAEIQSKNITGHGYRGYSISGTSVKQVNAVATGKRPIWFVYSGMGSQYPEIAKHMMQLEVFKTSICGSADTLLQHDIDLLDLLQNAKEDTFEDILSSFLAIVSIQIALTDVLKSLGVEPDGIIGHSVGEAGCAYADGTLTANQTILAAYNRGRAILSCDIEPGSMASVGLTWEECRIRCPPEICLACHNSEDNVTLSGPPQAIQEFVASLHAENVFAKIVNSSGYAFHSKYVANSEQTFKLLMEKVIPCPKPRSSRWISTSIPESAWSSPLAQLSSADYFSNNLISPVLFYDGLKHIPENAITIEIAPHGILQAILRRALKSSITNITLMNRNEVDQVKFFLSSIGKLYNAGGHPKISALYHPVTFPVGRGTPMISPFIKWDHSADWQVARYAGEDYTTSCSVAKINLTNEKHQYLSGHEIDGRLLFPAAGYLILVWKTLAKLKLQDFETMPVIIKDIHISRATIIPTDGTIQFTISILEKSGEFEICEGSSIVASGNILVPEFIDLQELDDKPKKHLLELNALDIYKDLRLRGYDYKGLFCGIVNSDLIGCEGYLKWETNWVTFLDTMLQFSVLGTPTHDLYLPTNLLRVAINPLLHAKVVAGLQKEDYVPIHLNRELEIIKSGGIEVRGLRCTVSQRNQQALPTPKLETYEFTPLCQTITTQDKLKSQHLALTIISQIVIENNYDNNMLKIIEIPGETCLAPVLKGIVETEPSIRVDYIVVNPTESNVSELVNIGVKTCTRNTSLGAFEQDANLVVLVDSCNNRNLLKNAIASLKCPKGFILVEETNSLIDEKTINELDLEIVSMQMVTATLKTYALVCKITKVTVAPCILPITGKTLEWVEPLKNAMKKSEIDNSNIYLVSQDEECNGLIGMVNCLIKEPGGHNIHSYFIQSSNSEQFNIVSPFYSTQVKKGLLHNVLSEANIWGTYRHLPFNNSHKQSNVEHAFIKTTTHGDLSSLNWIRGPLEHHSCDQNEELVKIYYASLNFKDIMIATGKLTFDHRVKDSVLGLEFSGRDSRGRRVMGVVNDHGLATSCIADLDSLLEIPEKWSMEEAATIPVIYGTSYYALIIRGNMRPGESILIHSGAGGVGLASIMIALHMGCTIFTTVGSKAKRDFLKKRFRQLDDDHIGNSRDTSFENLIMKQTGGCGVDLVLNSLAGELLQASVRCLARDGRFLEIGKVDILNNSALGLHILSRNTSIHGVYLNDSVSFVKNEVGRLLREGIKNGCVQPLPSTIFAESEIEQAFRYMASGKHIGKVLIKIRNEEKCTQVMPQFKTVMAISHTYMNPNKTYILVGGLGGFGLELANWLVSQGATKIVLTSRYGIKTGYQSLCLMRWRKCGVNVVVSTIDVTNESSAIKLIEECNNMGPVGGIFNLAVVIHDAMMENLTVDDFETVIKAKIGITQYLDTASRQLSPHLDYFVVFSSVVSGRGNVGQANYGYANSAMERIIEQRRLDGFPGTAIQWGAVGDVGLLAEKIGNNSTEIGGTLPQRMISCLDTLAIFLNHSHAIVSSMVLAIRNNDNFTDVNKINITSVVGNIIGIKDINTVSPTTTLLELGIDSLMVTEIKQTLERRYNVILKVQEIKNLTFRQLTELSGKLELASPTTENKSGNDSKNGTNAVISDDIFPKKLVVQMSNNTTFNGKSPIWAIHAIDGTVAQYQELAELANVPMYGLQCTVDCPTNSITELAQFYIKQIQAVQREGPYVIIGYSFGSCIAFEMGIQLETQGKITELVLIDGSHNYITDKTNQVYESEATRQSMALVNFASQFDTIDQDKVLHALTALATHDERVTEITKYLSNSLPYSIRDIKEAAYSFYYKLEAADNYHSAATFNGNVTLIKKQNNSSSVEDDYGLQKVCKQHVKVITVEGGHNTILKGSNVTKIADTLNDIIKDLCK